MFSVSLSFSDPEFERKYRKDCDSIKFVNFYKFILCEMFLSFIILLFQIIYDAGNTIRVCLLITVSVITLFVVLLDHILKKWRHLNSLYIFIHMGILFTTVELISETRAKEPENFHLKVLEYSSPLQVLFCSILIAQLKWGFSILFSIIFQAFFVFRFFQTEEILENPVIVIVHFLCVLVFSLMGYYIEKSARMSYKIINERNEKLVNFEILLKNIIPSPIFILDIENHTTEFINVSATEMLENLQILKEESIYDAAETLLFMFKPMDLSNEIPKLGKLYKTLMKEFEKKLEFVTIEASLTTESGPPAYFQLKFLKMKWNNSKSCILIILDDITQSHRIQELKNLDNYKNQLLATVSHDLRTPLNGMLGMIELVSSNITDKKDKKNLQIAMASGHLLLSMINDILDFSQINNKKLRLNVQKIDLIEICKQTSKMIKFQAKSKGLIFELKTFGIVRGIINSDSNRIRQILLNLLNNALKFTQRGFIKLKLKKQYDFNYNGFLFKLEVKDSGIGIKDEDIPKLFKLFGKLECEDPETNRAGVGLGLTISQNLSKMLSPRLSNAGIHLKSQYGKGSKFWFYLEGERTEEEPISALSMEFCLKNLPYLFLHSQDKDLSYEHKPTSCILKEKVLIVDDDMVNLMVAKRYCEYFAVDFFTANNGAEAIQVIEEYLNKGSKDSEIKGILMDCNMPIVDGYKATKVILDLLRSKKAGEIPIIGMTANVLNEDLENCLKCGMKSFLCKPVSRVDFGNVLNESFKIKVKKF